MKINKLQIKAFLLNCLLVFIFLVLPMTVLAQSYVHEGLETAGSTAEINSDVSIFTYTALIVRTVLGLMGIVVLLLVVYAGVMYLGAQGNPDKIKKATNILLSAALGLIVVFGAYSITNYVVDLLQKQTLK